MYLSWLSLAFTCCSNNDLKSDVHACVCVCVGGLFERYL